MVGEEAGRPRGGMEGGISCVRKRCYTSDENEGSQCDRMIGIAYKILRKVRAHGRGQWVCTPKDFLDLGSRVAIDQALSRLVKAGQIRRVGRGLYDLPRISRVMNRPVPPNIDAAVAALARRDNIRVMPDGLVAANRLGLTNAVPAKADYVTDGASRTVKVDGWTIRLRHARPTIMNWAGSPAAPVVQALHWLGPRSVDDQTVSILRKQLPDAVKRDLVKGIPGLPDPTSALLPFWRRKNGENAGVCRWEGILWC